MYINATKRNATNSTIVYVRAGSGKTHNTIGCQNRQKNYHLIYTIVSYGSRKADQLKNSCKSCTEKRISGEKTQALQAPQPGATRQLPHQELLIFAKFLQNLSERNYAKIHCPQKGFAERREG